MNQVKEDLICEIIRLSQTNLLDKFCANKNGETKEQIVVDCEFNNNVLNSEDGAEFDYRPTACRPNYRTIVVRKNLSVEKGGNILFDDIRDFFYITKCDPCHNVIIYVR